MTWIVIAVSLTPTSVACNGLLAHAAAMSFAVSAWPPPPADVDVGVTVDLGVTVDVGAAVNFFSVCPHPAAINAITIRHEPIRLFRSMLKTPNSAPAAQRKKAANIRALRRRLATVALFTLTPM
jgi:hypothetical protein